MEQISKKPHIVWIVLDTHRFDRIGAYGYARPTTPNLDAFAQTATLFERAIAPAQWTVPSHASMFTGEFPTTHLTNQSGDSLDDYFRTAAEWLQRSGYQTTGFCNNPLVGVIDNGFKRGFDTFYNYGGAVPSTPAHASHQPGRLMAQLWERYTQLLRRISYPVQNAVARSERIFHLTLNPLFVPLWTRLANFKGDTGQSILDASHFIHKEFSSSQAERQFVFINLMETHLPFAPPQSFTRRFAPLVTDESEASNFMRFYNTQALRWLLPMDVPFSALEFQTLSDMYDAEVAYQDHLLASLFELLDAPYHREHTAVIVVSDHGEMLGEHNLMGHGFGVYEELVRVPLIVRLPGQSEGRHILETTSTAQIFHTLLDFAQVDGTGEDADVFARLAQPLESLSLARFKPEDASPQVVSEAYPPNNVIRLMEQRQPALLDAFKCRATVRAAYNQAGEKLIQTEGFASHLYQIVNDPLETAGVSAGSPEIKHSLETDLERFIETAVERQPENWTRAQVNLDDQLIKRRLRSLGYLE